MKRKILSLLVTVILLVQLVVPAAVSGATLDAKICSSYWSEGVLYTFAQFQSADPTENEVSLIVNNALHQRTKPKTLKDADADIHFMLLIDSSNSMFSYRNKLITLAQQLLSSSQNVRISIAKFNDKSAVVAEDLTRLDDVKAALKKLTYLKDGSNISGSVADMLEYLGEKGYIKGSMTNLLVITDGEPWYTNNKNKEQQREAEANEAAAAMMKAYPEIVVHSYCFDSWNADVYKTLSAGKGLHQEGISVEEAGKALKDYVESIYSITFELAGYEKKETIGDPLNLWVGSSVLVYDSVRNVEVKPNPNKDTQKETNPKETTVPETTEATVPETTDATQGTEGTEETEGTEGTKPADTTGTRPTQTDGTSVPTDTSGGGGKENPDRKRMLMIIGGAAAVVVVLIVVIALIAGKQRKRKNSVPMRVEFVEGGRGNGKNVYYLSRELLIGSDKNCDIRIPGSGAAARIFMQGQMIYVEDMGAQGGTALNGMRIFSSNRLRSGDEITVGTVKIRILF